MVFAGLCQRLGFAVAARVDVCDVAGKVTDEIAAGNPVWQADFCFRIISLSE